MTSDTDAESAEAVSRFRRPSLGWRVLLPAVAVASVALAVNHVFNLGFGVGYTLLENQYFYAIVGLLLPLVFVYWPAYRGAPRDRVPWYDVVLFVLAVSASAYYLINGERIVDDGWEYSAPQTAVYVSYLFWLLVLEAARRAGGVPLFTIITVISLYPVYADKVPGPISGLSATLGDSAIPPVRKIWTPSCTVRSG